MPLLLQLKQTHVLATVFEKTRNNVAPNLIKLRNDYVTY